MVRTRLLCTGQLLLATMLALSLLACQEAAPPKGTTPAVPVDVATVISAPLSRTDEFSGRLQAPQTVQLMPRVSGYLQAVHFSEGSAVKTGDLLFSLDDAPFRTEVARLSASLQEAQSAAALAKRDYQRAQQLQKQQAIAVELLDNRLSRYEQMQAQVAAIEAALDKALLDLSYSQVRAPIDGVISNAFITSGNYVQAGQSVLSTVVSSGKVYAWVEADEQSLLRYLQQTDGSSRPNGKPVQLALSNSSEFAYQGQLDFIDNQLDSSSGTIRLRASFANTDGKLLPGLFVRLRLPSTAASETLLVRDTAIGTDLSSRYVLVVSADHQLQYRPVQLGEKIANLRVIRSGLQPGETIVVNGLQRVRPGVIVAPQPTEMADANQRQLLSKASQAFTATTASIVAPATPGLAAPTNHQTNSSAPANVSGPGE